MEKAKRKSSKDKGEKTKEEKSSEPDPNLYFGNGEFTLPNGDSYAGDYCAHRCGLIWREGRGIYTTKDGQTYEGEWKDDKLVAEKELFIKYPTGEEYRGPILQDKYCGAGTYTMENKMDVSCEFADNKPKGNVVLIDINRRIWEGPAGETKALLLPENEFYNSISETQGIGKLKPKYQRKEELVLLEESQKSEPSVLTDRELEQIVFAKSRKTASNIDFTASKWCQRYLRYRAMKDAISQKLKAESAESLTEEETKWKRKYERHKRELNNKKVGQLTQSDSAMDISLLEAFYSKEFKNSCPPMKVFYPSCDWVENYLQNIENEQTEVQEHVENAEEATEEATEMQEPTSKKAGKNTATEKTLKGKKK